MADQNCPMLIFLSILVSILTVVTWGYMLDHRSDLGWRQGPVRGAMPRTDVNQQWTVVDR
jgi:hypothetical protein